MASTVLLPRLTREVLRTGCRRVWYRGIHLGSCRLLDFPPSKPITSTSYIYGTCQVPLSNKTVHQCLAETTERIPDQEAIVLVRDSIRKTFSQLSKDAETLAAGLLALGLKKGDRLGMWGPNSYEWLVMQFATAQAGILMACINPGYQPKEVEYVLKKVGCSALVFPSQFKTQKYYEILSQICPELATSPAGGIQSKNLPDLRTVIVLDEKFPGTFQFQDVMDAGSPSFVHQLQDIQKSISCDDPINIQFTSGTTGSPKGATLSHHNIVNNATFAGLRVGFDWKKGIRVALPVPLYHCMGCVLGSIVMAIFGSTLVLPSPSFEARAVLEAISKEKCNYMYGTPTMYIDLLGQPDFHEHTSTMTAGCPPIDRALGFVKCMSNSHLPLETSPITSFSVIPPHLHQSNGFVAGSIVPPEIMKKILNETMMKEAVIGYGTTENSPVTFLGFPNDDIVRRVETVGHVMSNTEAKVVDVNTGLTVPLNTPGELMIRGYCVMLGYWGDLEKTKETITPENWYKTGDIAVLDEFGYCRIVGRCKDMIIRGGENIYPAEIEQFLHTHPKIIEAQIVGVKDERMGEEICACIRIRGKESCTVEEIKEYCKGKISHFKVPRYIEFVEEYPLTISGKVQKFKLREQMEKHLNL